MEQAQIKSLLQSKIFAHPRAKNYNSYSQNVLRQLSRCHTIRLGMHLYRCNNCTHQHHQYHSCGNRHCPNCGGLKREQWLQDRMSELLPTTYFHLVFTLPQQLRSLTLGNRSLLFNLLFEASTYTIRKLSMDVKYLGAVPGIITVLHTNGQDLCFHPHVHCIVTGGGFSKDKKWITQKRKNGHFLFPRRAMEKIFKAYFLEKLQQYYQQQLLKTVEGFCFEALIKQVGCIKWNVYAKAPFGGPAQIVEYLGRYTHKVAISTHRIKEISDETITFSYKDYRDGNKQKLMILSHQEFLRRFEQHILPKGFVKIRHSGFLSHQHKGERLKMICEQLQIAALPAKVALPVEVLAAMRYGVDIRKCSVCQNGTMELIASYVNASHVGVQLVNVEQLQPRNKASPRMAVTTNSL